MEGNEEADSGKSITLEDVEVMIGILERFVRLSKKASRILRNIAPQRSGMQGDMMQNLMSMAFQSKMGAQQELEEDDEPLDEETKKLIAKLRAKPKS